MNIEGEVIKMRKWIATLSFVTSLTLCSAVSVAAASSTSNIANFEANSLTKSDGSYWVWGHNYSVPTQIQGLTDVKSTFGQHFVVKNDGTVWQWERKPNSPVVNIFPVEGVENVIATDYQDPLILDVEGKIYQMPDDNSSAAILIPNIDNVIDITNYYNYKENKYQWLFLKKDGTVWTSLDSYQTFQPIPYLEHVADVEQNNALKEDGTVWSWPNEYKQHDTDQEKAAGQTAIKIEGLNQIETMYVQNNAKLAVDNKSRLWFWGSTVTGMSDGTTYHEQPAPILLTSIEDVKEAYIVERSLIVLTNNGKVYETLYERELMPKNPSFTLLTSDVAQIKSGARHLIMQKNDGSLWGWGVNKNAELGHGDYEFMYRMPVPLQSPITILLNGKSVQLTNGVIVKGGQAFIPIRSIFEQLGASVSWDNTNKIAAITRTQSGIPSVNIEINYKTGELTSNGKVILLQNEAFSSASISYLPLRFISESLGAKVDWVQQEQKIMITMQ
jgi:hypothetical protein